jgi:hypothetical protein
MSYDVAVVTGAEHHIVARLNELLTGLAGSDARCPASRSIAAAECV